MKKMLKDMYGREAKFANFFGYSDVTPYEIVNVISDKTIEIREMDAERDKKVKLNWEVGGFSGVCTNQDEQKWIISSNTANPVIRARLHKNGKWKSKVGTHHLENKAHKFHDYNF